MWLTLGSGWLDGTFDQRECVGRNMTADQIAKAERLAEEWRAAHPLLDVGRGQLLRLTVPTDPSEDSPGDIISAPSSTTRA